MHVGQQINDIKVKALNGQDETLRIKTGKVLIINLWATWCAPCRHEMPSLDRLSTILDKKRFTVVGISVDDDDHVVREFLIDRKVTFKNYLDPAMVVANDIFGIRVFPSTFIISPSGTLLKVIEGWRDWDAPELIKELEALRVSKEMT
ncbi:MAG: TlpA family protein disulfide reductase [Gammaproteobacteria bacterium]|nr:TlpA family protein disulfide reductase [Gammaproteobacteria bacterium]